MENKKVVMITGATGGMGKVLCEDLAKKGMALILTSNQKEELELQKKFLEETYGASVYSEYADITQEQDVAGFVKRAGDQYGKIDALINLAGLSIPGKIVETEEAVYDVMMDVNVKGTYLMSKYFSHYAADEALIINIGSMAARRTNANAPLYCMAKSAVNVLSQGLSMQLAAQGIRVTTLNPGGADTPFWGDRPVKRDKLLKVRDVVDVILFVLSANPKVAIHAIDFESFQMLG